MIDNVSLTVVAGSLSFMLINNTTGAELLEEPVIVNLQDLPRAGEPAEFDVNINYYGCNPSTTYALVIERSGNLSDSNYFQLMYNDDEYANGALYFYNGSTWVALENFAGTDLYFKIYYNQSQELYGLRESLITSPPTTDYDLLKKYINGYLATIDRPTKRAVIQLAGVRDMLEAQMPDVSLGMVAFRIGETSLDDVDGLNIQSINYNMSDYGITADIEAGDRLPDIGRLFARLQHDIQNQISTYGNN